MIKKYLTNYLKICVFILALLYNSTVIVSAFTIIDSCGILETTKEKYILINNVSTDELTCFNITANDVILECNGYSINMNANSEIKGIYSEYNNSKINNCNIPLSTPQINIADTKKALFDIIAEIVTEPETSGDDLVIKLSLINFGTSDTIDANLKYTISDENGRIFAEYNKIVPVTTQTEFLEHITTSGIKNGKYKLTVELTYIGQTFPAITEKIFYIGLITPLFTNVKQIFTKISIKTYAFSIITTLLLISIYIKNRKNRLKELHEEKNI